MDHQHAGFAHSSSCLDRSQRSTAHEQERGQVLLIFSRKTENAPGQDPAPVLYTWGVSWLENTFNLQNSSPGMEFLLNRATISSYGHCGLTSTSWGKKKLSSTFPGWAVARHWNKNMQQLHKLCKWSKLYSEYMVWWENSSVHRMTGQEAHYDKLTWVRKTKKNKKTPYLESSYWI